METINLKKGETIRLGDEVTITAIGSYHGVIRLGIETMRELPMRRQEVWIRLQEENEIKRYQAGEPSRQLDDGDE